jgi:hypothetical protein
MLYFLLVPIYGGPGAATGYTVGSIIGCVVSLDISRKLECRYYGRNFIIFIVPTTLAFAMGYYEINLISCIIATTALS